MSDLRLHKVRVTSGAIGIGTRTWVDDHELQGARDISIHFGLNEPNRLEIELLASEYDIEADAGVQYRISTVDPHDGYRLLGHGETPWAAFESVAQQLRARAAERKEPVGG